MNERMKIEKWVIIAIVGAIVITIVLPQMFPFAPFNRDFPPERPEWTKFSPYLLFAKTILSSVNSILLIILLVIYAGIYRKTGSEFSMGLIIFSLALFLYSLTSNPLIHRLAGFRLKGLGPFTMLPDLFTCIASAMLLYLSRE